MISYGAGSHLDFLQRVGTCCKTSNTQRSMGASLGRIHFFSLRFGRDERSSMMGDGRIHSRGWDSMAPPFWSMAVPQRFGRKK
uniref:Uncharacterized protein n=1 Tax=Leptobrachium leishanense TaxID=445787 RepID=A0A8C5PAA0_9ANUR